jgi:hypothetical protein
VVRLILLAFLQLMWPAMFLLVAIIKIWRASRREKRRVRDERFTAYLRWEDGIRNECALYIEEVLSSVT